jgi:nucleolar protein 9
MRRKLIAGLYGHMGSALALSPPGASVLLDGVWPGTRGIAFVRERVAEELAENEHTIKANGSGRRVWRGWGMDAFGRRRREWERWSRVDGGSGGGFVGFPESLGASRQKDGHAEGHAQSPRGEAANGSVKKKERHLTALERARERHMEKAKREKAGGSAPIFSAS